jgi:hypothetical protein
MMLPGRRFKIRISMIGLVLLIGSVLAACSGENLAERAPASFRAPTVPPEATAPALFAPTFTPTIFSPPVRPTPTQVCTNLLLFLEDVTIPDGTLTQSGESLDKRWRVRNNGTCNWDENYRLKKVDGPELGAPPEIALYPARSGAETEIQIRFTAPAEPGTYRSAWQAHDPQGISFGDPFYIEIVVEASSP